jgi:predicted helicase
MNLAVCVSGNGSTNEFSVIMVSAVPCYDMLSKAQCFPLHTFCDKEKESEATMTKYAGNLFANDIETPQRKENITDAALTAFRAQYKDEAIEKEDIFFYTYGILHSSEYRKRFADNLRRQLPRIPFAPDFWAFSEAGEKLAELHVEYEQVEPWPLDELGTENEPKDAAGRKRFYRVEKMSYGGKSRDKDKTILHYNNSITMTGIPPEAHEYIVNGKPALDWLVERYAVTTGKQSGLLNDPNEWSDDPRYILDLFKRVTRVAVETVRIVRALPPLE